VNTSGARGAELFKNNCKVSLQVATEFYSFEVINIGAV
jgi:phosphatidylserine decarboxylase